METTTTIHERSLYRGRADRNFRMSFWVFIARKCILRGVSGIKRGFSCNALVTGLHASDQLPLLNEENPRLAALQACLGLLT
jgi:hypothetical protein